MTEATAKAQGRPKDPEKRTAIIEAARKLFLDQGYERTTVDAIAAGAGVSKLTVYSHFEGKEGLFKYLITCKCEEYFGGRDFNQLAELEPRQALTRIARSFMGLMFNPDVVALHRILMANAQSSDLTAMFYETGPRPTIQAVADLLVRYDQNGVLTIEDPQRAADHFLSMLRGDSYLRALLNIESQPSDRQLQHHIKDCVAVFLRAYARRA